MLKVFEGFNGEKYSYYNMYHTLLGLFGLLVKKTLKIFVEMFIVNVKSPGAPATGRQCAQVPRDDDQPHHQPVHGHRAHIVSIRENPHRFVG